MKLFKVITVLILNLFLVAAEDYDNYKVYKISPNKHQFASLMKWELIKGIDFWLRGGSKLSSQVMVSPAVEDSFLKFLLENEIKHEVHIEDVGSVLRDEKSTRLHSRHKRSTGDELNFELYWTFEEMEAYSIKLAQEYPNLVSRDVIGQSIEGRDIFALRVSSGSEFGKKPIIFLDTGTHAREWVGPHTVLFFLHQMVTNSSVTNEILDKVDYVIIPNVNPDGYVYAQTEDRLWRKNRRYVNYTCTGVDLNRNYAYVWQQVPESCETLNYPGEHALSEPEIYAVATYMESFKYNLRLYLTAHSAGPLMLWPYGFDFDIYAKNWREHHLVGQIWADAIYKSTGVSYVVGNSATVLYTAYGASDDFALAYANANLAYTIELPPGPDNRYIYPQDMIYDLAKGTFHGYQSLGKYIGETYNYD